MLITAPVSLPTQITLLNIEQLYEQVVQAGNIQDYIAISNFLNLVEEEVDIQEDG